MVLGRKVLIALNLSIAALLCAAVPASATGPGGGAIEFTGTAFLPTFPCDVGNTCSGTFQGTANGSLAGVDGTSPWTAALALAPISATYTYTDPCVGIDGIQANAIGIAGGDGTITMSLGGAPVGTYGPAPGLPVSTPLIVTAISVSFHFDWARVGTSAVATTSNDVSLQVLMPSGPTWVSVLAAQLGTIVATFAPTASPPSCDAPGPLPALIAAGITIS